MVWHVGDGTVRIGLFITSLVNFLIIAFAVFIVVKLFEKLQRLRPAADEDPEALSRTDELLTEIRDSLSTQQR